jgi:hypothetical protein
MASFYGVMSGKAKFCAQCVLFSAVHPGELPHFPGADFRYWFYFLRSTSYPSVFELFASTAL